MRGPSTVTLLAALAIAAAAPAPARAGDAPAPPPPATFKAAKDAFEKRDYDGVKKSCEAALVAEPGFAPAEVLLAFIAFYFGDDKGAHDRLDRALTHPDRLKIKDDDWDFAVEAEGLRTVLDNPFKDAFGEDAPKLCGKTKGGHYLLMTDCGAGDLKKVKAGQQTKGHADIGQLLEKIFDSYSAVFRFEKDRRLLSRVIVFDKRADYEAFSKKLDPTDNGKDSAGYYQPFYRLLVVSNDPIGERRGPLYTDSMDTMFHEGFHQFLDFFIADAPYWFNEGIAEYFGPSELLPGGKELRVGVVVKERKDGFTRYQAIKEYTRAGAKEGPSPLRDLMLMDGDAFMKRADVHYAESWSLIHYFMHGTPTGKDLLVRYFKALKAGKDAEAAFDDTFGKVDMKALEADWRRYVQGL